MFKASGSCLRAGGVGPPFVVVILVTDQIETLVFGHRYCERFCEAAGESEQIAGERAKYEVARFVGCIF